MMLQAVWLVSVTVLAQARSPQRRTLGQVYCTALVVPNGSFISNKTTDQFLPGDVLSFRCDDGHYMEIDDDDGYYYYYNNNAENDSVDVYSVTCGSSGQWSPLPPICTELRCTPFDEPTRRRHGLLVTDSRTNNSIHDLPRSYYTVGETVQYQCDPGFDLHGVKTRTCSLADRGWDTIEETICLRISCPAINNLDNGEVFGRTSTYNVGDTVFFRCNSGSFSLYGPTNRTCLETWRWTGTTPTCDDGSWDCPDPGIPAGAIKTGNHYNFGNKVRYRCKAGYILRGSEERECLSNGLWSGLDTVCDSLFAYDTPEEAANNLLPALERLKYYTATSNLKETNHLISTRGKRSLWRLLGRGLDLYFVFDVSGSIKESEFDKSILFVMKLIEEVGIGSASDGAGTRIGIISFSDTTTVELRPDDRTVTNITDVQNRLRRIEHKKRGTCISCAFQELRQSVIPTSKRVLPHRTNVKTAIMLLTDGRHNMGGDPNRETDLLKDSGRSGYDAEIFIIGITNRVDREVLEEMASFPKHEHVYLFQDYAGLHALVTLLTTGRADYSACGVAHEPTGIETRVVGGGEAPEGKWRWQAGLFFGSGHDTLAEKIHNRYGLECGGTLIAEEWVLSAATCFIGHHLEVRRGARNVYVKLGIANLQNEDRLLRQRQNLDVDEVYIHEGYDPATLENDIALLHLKTPATLGPYVGTVCLPDMEDFDVSEGFEMYSGRGTVTGWGTTERRLSVDPRPARISPQLREVELPIQDDETCIRNHRDEFMPNTFCAGAGVPDEDGAWRDSCMGDSGGPFVRKIMIDPVTRETRWIQLGIVSRGNGCAVRGEHGVYVKVSAYTDWIRTIQRGHERLNT